MESNLNDMNPKEGHIIDNLKKGSTPLPSDDYFELLKLDVFEKIGTTETVKVIPLYKKWWFLTSAAASIAIIITLLLPGQEHTPLAKSKVDWNSVSREEVLAYINDNIDDFDAHTLAEHLDSIPSWSTLPGNADTLSVASNDTRKQDKYDDLFQDIEKEDILEYLEEETIDIDDEWLMGS